MQPVSGPTRTISLYCSSCCPAGEDRRLGIDRWKDSQHDLVLRKHQQMVSTWSTVQGMGRGEVVLGMFGAHSCMCIHSTPGSKGACALKNATLYHARQNNPFVFFKAEMGKYATNMHSCHTTRYTTCSCAPDNACMIVQGRHVALHRLEGAHKRVYGKQHGAEATLLALHACVFSGLVWRAGSPLPRTNYLPHTPTIHTAWLHDEHILNIDRERDDAGAQEARGIAIRPPSLCRRRQVQQQCNYSVPYNASTMVRHMAGGA